MYTIWKWLRSFGFLAIYSLLALIITGYLAREHRVLQPTEVALKKGNVSAERLAAKYLPAITSNQEVDQIWYEVQKEEEVVNVNYFFENPGSERAAWSKAYDFIKNSFSSTAYAVISLKLDNSGEIKEVLYSASSNNYPFPLPYDYDYKKLKATSIADLTFRLEGDGYTFVKSEAGAKPFVARLNYLDNGTYKWRKLARQPRGFFFTKEGAATFGIVLFTGFIFTMYFTGLVVDYDKRKKLKVVKSNSEEVPESV
jgi:hypothetical protein